MDAVDITSEIDTKIFRDFTLVPDNKMTASFFLVLIAEYSDSSQIDPKYKSYGEVNALLSEYPDLIEDLKRAFHAKSCESLRANGEFSMP